MPSSASLVIRILSHPTPKDIHLPLLSFSVRESEYKLHLRAENDADRLRQIDMSGMWSVMVLVAGLTVDTRFGGINNHACVV